MPTIDGAYGFLTVLLPLHTEPCRRGDGTITSPAHAVREALAKWPTAQHSPACTAAGLQSPFARSPVTHLARFAVIDQPAFNGRDPQDAILTALNLGPSLSEDPEVDRLQRPYLLFCADFDAAEAATDPVRLYLLDLWARMEPEWTALLTHCEGWRAGAQASDFADYVAACQIETTMPFNDYGVEPGPISDAPPLLIPLALALTAFVVTLGLVRVLSSGLSTGLAWGLGMILAAAAALAAALAAIDRIARRPQPWAGGQDLCTVLKALDLQARFTRFALDHQGAAQAELQSAFLAFLEEARPDDLAHPTQAPGVVPQPMTAS